MMAMVLYGAPLLILHGEEFQARLKKALVGTHMVVRNIVPAILLLSMTKGFSTHRLDILTAIRMMDLDISGVQLLILHGEEFQAKLKTVLYGIHTVVKNILKVKTFNILGLFDYE